MERYWWTTAAARSRVAPARAGDRRRRRDTLLKSLPLPANVVTRWLSLQPTGSLRSIDVRWRDDGEQSRLGRFHAEGSVELDGIGWRAQDACPVSGLSGRINGSTRDGELQMAVGAPPPTDSKRIPVAFANSAKSNVASATKQQFALDFGSIVQRAAGL